MPAVPAGSRSAGNPHLPSPKGRGKFRTTSFAPWRERKCVEAKVAEVVDEFDRTVRAMNLAGLDAADGFDELVEIGVVGERQRVVDAPAIFGARVDGPAGAGDRDGAAEARETEVVHAARQRDDCGGLRVEGRGLRVGGALLGEPALARVAM